MLSVEPTPRGPLKRTKRRNSENQAPVAAVNGSRDVENGTEDEGGMPQLTQLTQFSLFTTTVNSQSAVCEYFLTFF